MKLKWLFFAFLSREEKEKLLVELQREILSFKLKLISSGLEIPELLGGLDLKFFTENKKINFDEDFLQHVLIPAKKVSGIPALLFDKHMVIKGITNAEIMEIFQISESKGLMTREEILRAINYFMGLQTSGGKRILRTRSLSNVIGHILCDDGVIRFICVEQDIKKETWFCYCSKKPFMWFAADYVFSFKKRLS